VALRLEIYIRVGTAAFKASVRKIYFSTVGIVENRPDRSEKMLVHFGKLLTCRLAYQWISAADSLTGVWHRFGATMTGIAMVESLSA
jgi:hypothetical protein